ncbi:MAG: hypothetical protein M3525_15395, partial [Acidobacteriota bacterium]|nr:hypothetical protein [Acidobacteriota bacterium]
MEEIFNEKPAAPVDSPIESRAAAKQSWQEWFATDEAMRRIYLFFGLFAIILLMIFLQFSTS